MLARSGTKKLSTPILQMRCNGLILNGLTRTPLRSTAAGGEPKRRFVESGFGAADPKTESVA